MSALLLARRCHDNLCHTPKNNLWNLDGLSIEPRTHRDLASQCTSTSNSLLIWWKNSKIPGPFYYRANIFFFMVFFQPGIDRASDTNLGIEYEFKKEIKA